MTRAAIISAIVLAWAAFAVFVLGILVVPLVGHVVGVIP
jgi:hypothetical protein